MALTVDQVPGKVGDMLQMRNAEATRLERISLYLRDPDPSAHNRLTSVNGPLRWLPRDVPGEVRRLAEMSRVNMLRFVRDAVVQAMYVEGFKPARAAVDSPAWEIWQRNGMDARQTGVHRAALSYGASYVTVLPGDPVPVLRGVSPRRMTVAYGDDDEWPEYALELRRSPEKDKTLWRLFDDTTIWWVQVAEGMGAKGTDVIRSQEHRVGRVPVVRFRCTIDDDGDDVAGEVEPLIPLQDQINITTFGLLVAQHYSAFKQRWIIGWAAETEKELLDATARKVWNFDAEPGEMQIGEFSQTDLKGYLDSREATLRHLSTVSQTPAHELLGQMVNLSAEAMAMAQASHTRKVSERQMVMGESHEQALNLAGEMTGTPPDPSASVRWRDTESRSLSQVADALGKLVVGLGVPPRELWDRIPGVSEQDVERWKAAAAEGDAFAQLDQMLARQAAPAPAAGP